MPIPVSCPGCAARLNAPDAAAGKNVKCPKCKATVAVPAPLPPADFEVVEDAPPPEPAPQPRKKPVAAVEDDAEEAKPRKKSRGDDEPQAAKKKRPARDDDEEEDEDDRPRKKRGAAAPGGSSKVLIGAIAAVLLLAGGGFAVYWFAIRETPAETAGGGTGGTPDDPKPRDPKVVPGKTVTTGWRDFASAKFEFKASFPWGNPTEFPLPAPYPAVVNGNDTASIVVNRREGNEITYAFGISALRFRPKTSEAERQKAGDDYFYRIPVPKGMKRSETQPVTWAGRPAKEFVTESEAGTGKTERFTSRLLVTETCIYVGSVRDVGGLTPAEVARFYDSFELTPGTAPKPPDPKKTDPKEPPPPSLPPLPPGWVAFSDFAKRYEGQLPPGRQETVVNGRLAYLKDVGKGKILGGQYTEVVYPDKGLTVSMRLLVFDRETTPAERAALLGEYARRLAEVAGYVPAPLGVKWADLDATQEGHFPADHSQVRRYVVAGGCGFVLTLRGTKRPEFDELRAVLFDNVLPRPVQSGVGERIIQKGWEELSSDAGLFRVDMPATPAPALAPNKILEDAKLTGEFHQGVSVKDGRQEVYVAGYVKFPASATPAERRQARDLLLAALKPPGAPDKKPINFPEKLPRQIAWEEFQWLGKGDPEGGMVRFHESDNILRVLAARGKDIRESQDRVSFTQFFELLR